MTPWLLDYLRCPFCTSLLSVDVRLEEVNGELQYGILTCDQCRESFAVVEGIPLLGAQMSRLNVMDETSDQSVLPGVLLLQVVERIRAGDATGALALILNPTSLAAPSWTFDPRRKQRRRFIRTTASGDQNARASGLNLSTHVSFAERLKRPYRRMRAAWRRSRVPVWRKELAGFLRQNARSLSASQLIALYYGEYSGAHSMSDYFLFRFGQPRHLAALSAVSTLRNDGGIVLDLACGAGHLTHYLTYGLPATRAIGLDREFFRLYVAKLKMAPGAAFVCMSADLSLPFQTGTFTGVVCSDAFHYFRHKSIAANEIERVMAADGAVILTRVGNAVTEPNEGYELTTSGYLNLFPLLFPTLRSEEQLMADYLARRAPDLSVLGQAGISGQEKWLTLFASRRGTYFRAYERFTEMPHAIGRLVVNPIYRHRYTRPDGSIHLEFSFPSDWYAFEDAAYPTYTPMEATISADVVRALKEGRHEPAMEELLGRFELIGTPDRFLIDPVPGAA